MSTCPDWTDLEGWQAKKDAYEQGQQQTVPLQKQLTVQKTQDQQSAAQAVNDSASDNSSQMRTGIFAESPVSLMAVLSDDIVLDISPSARKYIEGAVNIDYARFLGNDGQLKPVLEMAKLLGDAGISHNDSIVIAGECLPCGGGPSPATFTCPAWALRWAPR